MANNYTPSYNQYRTQTAGYALPSSVKTYSVFDPATGTWTRMTNGNPVQSVVPVQPKQQSRSRSRQVMRPLVRSNARDVSAAINPQPIVVNGEESIGVNGSGMTPSGIEFVGGQPISLDRTQNIPPEYDGEIRNLNNVPTSFDVVGQPVVNVDPADIGQSVPIREVTPRLNLNGYTPPTRGEANLGRALGSAATAAVIPAIAGATLMYGPTVAGAALGLGRTALSGGLNLGRTALTSGLGAAAKVLPKNMTSRVSSWANSAVDASKGLFNKLGGFLHRPVTPEEAAAQAQQAAYQQAANIGAKVRAGQYYTY